MTDALGGDRRTSLLAMLSMPVGIPVLAKNGMRAFIFGNAGTLHSSDRNSDSNRNQSLFGSVRASVGAGLSISMADAVRLEMSYAFPILRAPQDQVKNFQLGISLSIN